VPVACSSGGSGLATWGASGFEESGGSGFEESGGSGLEESGASGFEADAPALSLSKMPEARARRSSGSLTDPYWARRTRESKHCGDV
jgi:hypothetical protein